MAEEAYLAMKTNTLSVMVLPELGGKIASLRWLPGNIDLLQMPLAPYQPRNRTSGFEESDASGFDECLPSVAACTVPMADGEVRVPDHGDLWRIAWNSEQRGNEIRLTAAGLSLPLHMERTLRLEGDTLNIQYEVRNAGESAADYLWSAHPLFAVERGDRLLLPQSVRQVRLEGSAAERLGKKGDCHNWPTTRSLRDQAIDLSQAGGIEDGVGDKLFTEAPPEGWAAIERRKQGVRIEVVFDAARTPWLGLWLCYGGWPHNRQNRQQCIAIEPCTAPVDSLAEAIDSGWGRRLESGAADHWSLQIRVRRVPLA